MRSHDLRLDNDTNEYGTTGPFKDYEGDHTALVHVLWAAKRRGLNLEDDADAIANMIMRSRWLAAQVNTAKAAAWDQSRETFGTDLLKPFGANGINDLWSTPNPYQVQQNPTT